MRRFRILTWHTRGSYLYYLSQVPHDFFVLAKPGRPPGYGGRSSNFPWGDNVHELPLDLVGIASEELGGLGGVPHGQLPALAARYRFLFSPSRYASLDLGVIEAMMAGLPVVALATTEMATVIDDGATGFIDTRIDRLFDCMRDLLRSPSLARGLGQAARRHARERFSIERFSADRDAAFRLVIGNAHSGSTACD